MSGTATLADQVAGWAPDPVVQYDVIVAKPVAGLSATLGHDRPVAQDGDELPVPWHWLSFLDWSARGDLGEDGHPRENDLFPPITDRRRMWASGRCTSLAPLLVGAPARRETEVVDVQPKRGRQGEVVFVTTRSSISQDGRPCLTDDVTAVYRSGEPDPAEAPRPTATATAPVWEAPPDSWSTQRLVDEVMLFRFSALTNGQLAPHPLRPGIRTGR